MHENQNSSASKIRRLIGLQYLRGIAAVLILIFHLCQYYRIDINLALVRVDIFFIISGFVMWTSTYNRELDFKAFIMPRLYRIVPLYWLATAAVLAVASIKPLFFSGIPNEANEVVMSLFFIPFHSNWWDESHIWPVLIQGWTLNIEIFFYLIFAAVLASGATLRLHKATIILCTLALIGFAFKPSTAIASIWTSPFLLELLAGLWLGYFYTSGYLNRSKWGWILIVASLSCFMLMQFYGYKAGSLRVLVMGLPTAILICGIVMLEVNRPLPYSRALAFLGDASYSIYLWHSIAITIIGAIGLRFGYSGGVGVIFLVGVCALVASLLAYIAIERPLVAMLRSRQRQNVLSPT